MTLTDLIAQEHIGLLKTADNNLYENNDAMLLSSMIQISDSCHNKKANFVPIRLSQQIEDMHQDDNTPDFWMIKQGKLIRCAIQKVIK